MNQRIKAKTKPLPLFDLSLSKATMHRVHAVLKSGWLSTGPVSAELEGEIARKFGVHHVAAVSSATAGLIASLKAAGVGAGDEVIIPSFTFIATAEAVTAVGAKVRFADINSKSWSIDPSDVRRKITRQTKAIIPVDYAGIPADYHALRTLAQRNKLTLISDSSHSLGASYHQEPISALTDFSVVSMHVTKNLTSAEGGLVICKSQASAERIRLLTRHGVTRNAWQRRSKGSVAYDVVADGLKANLSDILAAIALGELPLFSRNQKIRLKLARQYQRFLAPYADSIQMIDIPDESESTWHLFPIRLTKVSRQSQRDAVIAEMKNRGIECGIHYRPLHTMTLFRGHQDAKTLPVTEQLGKSVLILPLYPLMTATDIDRVVRELLHALRRCNILAKSNR